MWGYQACAEFLFPQATNGVSDFFPPSPYNITSVMQGCMASYNVTSQPYLYQIEYGTGSAESLAITSNIIFSNGALDPCAAYAVEFPEDAADKNLFQILITGAAHHLDLRLPNVADPLAVTEAPALEKKWLAEILASE